jgi:hypothetical protein
MGSSKSTKSHFYLQLTATVLVTIGGLNKELGTFDKSHEKKSLKLLGLRGRIYTAGQKVRGIL